MKNYPLLPLNHQKQWISWNKTYLTEIDHNIKSLWDYNNYFIPDFCQKELDITENSSIDASQLDYNEYFRATNKLEVMLGSNPTTLRLGAGFLLVSKARNEDENQYILDQNNYFVQPFGYGSFFIFTYNNAGQIAGIYNQYAEEKYGLDYMTSFFDHYPRFLMTQHQSHHDKVWILVSYIPSAEEKKAICTQSGTLWTDIVNLKPMFFHYKLDSGSTDFSNNQYGEEIVVDISDTYSINIDKTSVAQYNEVILERGNEHIWPENIIVRVI